MGGFGSGEYIRTGSKQLISSTIALDVRKLKKDKLLIPGIQFDSKWTINGNRAGVTVKVHKEYLLLEYTYKMTEQIVQEISLVWTPCNYGGGRLWFRCPYCGWRVAVVYGIEKKFACRQCHNLIYDSCKMPEYQRLFLRADKLKKKLKGNPGIVNPIPDRPKGMHHKTYERLQEKINLLNYVGLIKMLKSIER